MRLVSRAVREESFCFTPNNGELPIHIRSGRLREWLHENHMDRIIDITFPDETLASIVDRHGLERPRLRSMTKVEAREPVIVGVWPGDGSHILIDGGHRRWYWAKRGQHKLRGWAVPYELWSLFIFDPEGADVIKFHKTGELLPQRQRK